jgi:brefeldin A-inhibited guanine nucleotide-exchange protein
LEQLVLLQSKFFVQLQFLLPELLSLLESCIDQDSEGLARIGVSSLQLLLRQGGPVFDAGAWDHVVGTLERLFAASTPQALFDSRRATAPDATVGGGDVGDDLAVAPFGTGRIIGLRATSEVPAMVVQWSWGRGFIPLPSTAPPAAAPPTAPTQEAPKLTFNPKHVITQCVVQLELISSLEALTSAHMGSLGAAQVDRLLCMLETSAAFARDFNRDRELRLSLWEAGFMRFARAAAKLPSLLRQETSASKTLLRLLFALHRADAGEGEVVLARLRGAVEALVGRYEALDTVLRSAHSVGRSASTESPRGVSLEPTEGEVGRELSSLGPLVDAMLEGVLALDDSTWTKSLHWIYPCLTTLVEVGSHDVRKQLRQVLNARIGPLLLKH